MIPCRGYFNALAFLHTHKDLIFCFITKPTAVQLVETLWQLINNALDSLFTSYYALGHIRLEIRGRDI